MIYIVQGQIDYEGGATLGVFDDYDAALRRYSERPELTEGIRFHRHWIEHWEIGATEMTKLDMFEDIVTPHGRQS